MLRGANGPISRLLRPFGKPAQGWAHEWMAIVFTPLAKTLQRKHVSPNAITILGSILASGAGVTLALGRWNIAIGLMLASGFCDGFDGLLARQSQQITRFGAFLDSVLDRWSDSAFFVGLLVWYANADMRMHVILAALALVSSLMVSYTRARAEGIGAQCTRGLFTRLGRFVTLVVGLTLNLMTVALWIVVLLSTFTVVQRIYFTFRYVNDNLEG
jgi:CDP-diacylglycerol--glycerol-3-phosphate 3-phosphatidyltransferase